MAPTQSPILRKRNAAAGPLVLDRDALLSDKETPQTLVIEAAKSKPQVMIMLGEDEESHKYLYLQGISDRELADRISRAEGMLDKSSIFPDGGAKLRVLLNKQLAERERRKLHKFKQGPAKSFENKMSRTQKIGLSSSHTVFKSPSNLSDHINDSSQPNREHFGRHSSTPSHRQPDKGVSGYFEKNKLGDKVQLPTSCLLNSLENMGPILEPMTISEQAQFGTALLGHSLDAFASAHGGFLQLETENKKLTQHNSVLVNDNKSFHAEVNSLKSALVAQTARAELAQAERDLWLKEKEALIAAHQAELDAVIEKSRAEGYEQGQDELKGLQRPFMRQTHPHKA